MKIFLLLALSSILAIANMTPIEMGVRCVPEEGNLDCRKGLTFSFVVVGGGEMPVEYETKNWKNVISNVMEKLDTEETDKDTRFSDIYGVLVGAGMMGGGNKEKMGRTADLVEGVKTVDYPRK